MRRLLVVMMVLLGGILSAQVCIELPSPMYMNGNHKRAVIEDREVTFGNDDDISTLDSKSFSTLKEAAVFFVTYLSEGSEVFTPKVSLYFDGSIPFNMNGERIQQPNFQTYRIDGNKLIHVMNVKGRILSEELMCSTFEDACVEFVIKADSLNRLYEYTTSK